MFVMANNNLKQLTQFLENFAETLAYEAISEIAENSNRLCPMAKDKDHDFTKYPKHLRESMEIYQGENKIGQGTTTGNPQIQSKGKGTEASIIYTNDYALYVHEMPDSVNWTTPGTGPHYLGNPGQELNVSKVASKAFRNTRGGK